MQQTKNYEFNLIETSDTFSPDPLNENAKKTEAALDKLSAADSALAGRVQTLELRRFAVGWYEGTGLYETQFVPLDFAPKVVLAGRDRGMDHFIMATDELPHRPNDNAANRTLLLEVDGNGFRPGGDMNVPTAKYNYLALA